MEILCCNTIKEQQLIKLFIYFNGKIIEIDFVCTWHSLGSSEAAFSTAKLREAVLLEISTRQLGQVAIWSRKLKKKKPKTQKT